MSVVIYTKDDCPFCVKAKSLLHIKSMRFVETKIGVDVTREEFIEMYPEQKTVPLIIINGEKVGGYNELTKWFDSKRDA